MLLLVLIFSGHLPEFLIYSLMVVLVIYLPIYFIFVELPYRAAKHISAPIERVPVYSRETGELLDEAGHQEIEERFRQSARNRQFWLLCWVDRYLFELLVLAVIVLIAANWLAVLG